MTKILEFYDEPEKNPDNPPARLTDLSGWNDAVGQVNYIRCWAQLFYTTGLILKIFLIELSFLQIDKPVLYKSD